MSGFLDITPSSLSDMPSQVVVVTSKYLRLNDCSRTPFTLYLGGSSGIGLAMVELLLEKKAIVMNLDIQPPVNDNTQSAEWIKTDIAEWSSQPNAFKSIIAKHGNIDVVYANAGVAEGESALAERVDPATGDSAEPAWSTVKTNLLGTLTTVKLALHYMKKSQKGGRIIMTSSRGGMKRYSPMPT
jgi:NAD(P)-dependent dehydrogenase (short-subunit alcohol dehydrogenase family)